MTSQRRVTHRRTALATRMTARSIDEPGRASTPLELLFDLTFVVAIAQVVVEFGSSIMEGRAVEGIVPFVAVFFAIWWAWMNFTWFASGYDTDDVPYRLLTMLQMGGVLVLAAGVPDAFRSFDFSVIVIGYSIMRVALIAQWVRALVQHPESRPVAARYAIGIAALQIGWWARLALPDPLLGPSLGVLVVLELAVPLWAGGARRVAWHPHHIAERYGLFTIILLGESVLAATTGVSYALDQRGVSSDLVVVAVSGFVLLFSLWWLYFLEPAGHALGRRPERAYLWGYGHYGMFVALAALGAGLEVAVAATGHDAAAAPLAVTLAIGIPTALFLILLWALYAPFASDRVLRPGILCGAALVIVVLPLSVEALGVQGVTAAMSATCAAAVVATVDLGKRDQRRHTASS